MFRYLTDLTKGAAFYAITFALVLVAAVLPVGSKGGVAEILSMCAPFAAVLLMLLVVTRDSRSRDAWRSLGLGRTGRRAWAPALLLPALVLAASYAILWRTSYAAPALPVGFGVPSLLANLIVGFAITLVFALTEEIGWRGYLLPRLLPLGARRASLLTGLLHGLFHLPLLLLTPFYHSDGNRLIVVPLFLLALTLAGPIYGYLRLATGSVWPAAIAHASLNVAWNQLSLVTVASAPLAAEYLAGESGLLPLLGYALIAGWCLHRLGGVARRVTSPVAPATLVTTARVP